MCESIRVAVGTVDGKRLARGHFGDSPLFAIYIVTPRGWRPLELWRNTAASMEERGTATPGSSGR